MTSIIDKAFTEGYNEAADAYDAGNLEDCIAKCNDLLADSAIPRYHRIKTLILLGSIQGDWYDANESWVKADSLWRIVRRWHPIEEDAQIDAALEELRTALDDLRNDLNSADDNPGNVDYVAASDEMVGEFFSMTLAAEEEAPKEDDWQPPSSKSQDHEMESDSPKPSPMTTKPPPSLQVPAADEGESARGATEPGEHELPKGRYMIPARRREQAIRKMPSWRRGDMDMFGKKSFNDVHLKENEGIPTTEFLEASEAVAGLFDVLGATAFKPVKADMTGNIKKVRDRQLEAPVDSETLQDLVRNELKGKKHTATEGLLWLTRGLDFTAQGLRHNLENPTEELSVSFRHAYTGTLKPHHSFLVKPIFSAAMSATPYRKDFYPKLGDDQERVQKEMREWLGGLEKILAILNTFLASKEAKW